jgi:hypothetical protein
MAFPGAVQGCKFELPIIKGIRFDGHAGHSLCEAVPFNRDYELSLYKMSTHIQRKYSAHEQAAVVNRRFSLALSVSDRGLLYRSCSASAPAFA